MLNYYNKVALESEHLFYRLMPYHLSLDIHNRKGFPKNQYNPFCLRFTQHRFQFTMKPPHRMCWNQLIDTTLHRSNSGFFENLLIVSRIVAGTLVGRLVVLVQCQCITCSVMRWNVFLVVALVAAVFAEESLEDLVPLPFERLGKQVFLLLLKLMPMRRYHTIGTKCWRLLGIVNSIGKILNLKLIKNFNSVFCDFYLSTYCWELQKKHETAYFFIINALLGLAYISSI